MPNGIGIFKYQYRGGIHCHGVAKLNNGLGLCKLSDTALKGYLADVSEYESATVVNGKIANEKNLSEVLLDSLYL